MWLRGFAAVALLVQGGCALLVDASSLGAADAAAETGNVLSNGDFEHGTAGCGPGWTTTNGTMIRSSISHSGGSSCELCGVGAGAATLRATPAPASDVTGGATYYAQAWVKIEEGGSITQVTLDLEELVSGGGTLANQKGNATSTGWQLLQATTSPAKDGGWGIDFMVHGSGPEGGVAGCVLIDDAQLIAQ